MRLGDMTNIATPIKPARNVRGPHAVRAASMRKRLIDAAILVLCDVGYASTTTQLIMEEANVSRGAVLHHFPTKTDLMIAVAEYAATAQNRTVRDYLNSIEPGIGLYLAITRASWIAICQKPGQALIELIIAARSDPELKARLPEVIDRLQAQQLEEVWEIASGLGIRDRDAVERMVRLHRAATRGLAIEMRFSGSHASADEAMELLVKYKRYLTGSLLTRDSPMFEPPRGK